MGHFASGPGSTPGGTPGSIPGSTPADTGRRERQRLQERALIQERARHPRFAGRLEPADGCGVAVNPHCGDSVAVSLRFRVDLRRLEAVRCACRGCVLSVASADLMAELVAGRPPEEVEALACGMAALLRGEAPPEELQAAGAVALSTGLPARARCVLLPWQALRQALAVADGDGTARGAGGGVVSPGAAG